MLRYETSKEYFQYRQGPLATGIAFGSFIPTTKESKGNDWPEVQMHLLPALLTSISEVERLFNIDRDYLDGYFADLKGKHGVTLTYCHLRPNSRLVYMLLFIIKYNKRIKGGLASHIQGFWGEKNRF